MVQGMGRATCALCGARNSIIRVYLGMQHPRPNLIALSCKECGKTSSQMRTLGDYVGFAIIYSIITLLLVILGINVLGETLDTGWIATIAGILPFTVLPAWWSSRQADALAKLAPCEDISITSKITYLLITISLIAGIIGGGLLVYLVYVVD